MARKERDRAEFVAIMTREFPHRSPVQIADGCELLFRLVRRHQKLQEQACSIPVPDDHDAKCESQIRQVLAEVFPGTSAIFSGHPGGATVKIKVPSGLVNDWGWTGVVVPH